jgi:hypothetical protein
MDQQIMQNQTGPSDFKPLAIITPGEQTPERRHYFDSPQSSTCVRSTSSQDPLLTRGELIERMNSISGFSMHFGAAYHGLGRCYHSLPLSARGSSWVVKGMRDAVDDAFVVSHYKQLPDLVYIFSEISHRLSESQQYFHGAAGEWQAAEQQLRRCDMLLQEAGMRLRFLQTGLQSIWFSIGRDPAVRLDKGDVEANTRTTFETRWLSVLPQICFVCCTEPNVE